MKTEDILIDTKSMEPNIIDTFGENKSLCSFLFNQWDRIFPFQLMIIYMQGDCKQCTLKYSCHNKISFTNLENLAKSVHSNISQEDFIANLENFADKYSYH